MVDKYAAILVGLMYTEEGQQLVRGMILYRCDPNFWDKMLKAIAADEFAAFQAEIDQMFQSLKDKLHDFR